MIAATFQSRLAHGTWNMADAFCPATTPICELGMSFKSGSAST